MVVAAGISGKTYRAARAELDRVVAVTGSLASDDEAAIAEQALALADEIGPTSTGVSTRDLNGAIEDLCNVSITWIAEVE